MSMPYEEDEAQCSPTSALEKKRIVGEVEESFLMDSDAFIVENHRGSTIITKPHETWPQ